MKLDATDLRYLSTEEFRVLTAVSVYPFCSDMYVNDRMHAGRDGIQES